MKLPVVLAISTLMLATSAGASDEFRMICDFDQLTRTWEAEGGASPTVTVTSEKAHSGTSSLRVNVDRYGPILRATWGTRLHDIELSPETRFRFYVHGSPILKTRPNQPHGGLLLIESGGAGGGKDSHWLLDTPGELFAGGEWKEFITPPVSEATNPEWAKDVDGKIDLKRVSRAFFVLQMDDPDGTQQPFAIYMDDVAATGWQAQKPTIHPAENSSKPEHIRPVQRGFIGRKRDAGQAVTFSDLTGWKVLQYGGAEASFVRSEEEPLFGEPVGKLTYRGGGFVRLEPPKPIALSQFNAVLAWAFGNAWEWMPDPASPNVQLLLELTDASGEKHVIGLDRVGWRFWSLMHKQVKVDAASDERHSASGGDGNGRLDFPVTLTGIEIQGGTNVDYRSIYLDSLIFRQERPNLPKFEAKLDNLPFPTTPDTILPPSMSGPVRNGAVQRGDVIRFTARANDETIEYVFTPRTGTLSDVVARVNGKEFRPCDGGGPAIGGKLVTGKLVSVRLDADRVARTVWKTDLGIEYSLDLAVKGKSLICDWKSDDTRITELTMGSATGLTDYKLFEVPYLSMGFGTPPAILWNDGEYCFSMLDWYNTNASEFRSRTGRISDTSAAFNGGSVYLNLTDGTRNPLRERQFITVSRRFEEVLPNIPNPPSPFAEITGSNLYFHVGGTGTDRLRNWLKRWRLYREYGIDHVRLSQHEDGWSDGDMVGQGPQEFTMTLDASPELGDAQLIDYCREVKKLGWRIGLYSNYTDFSMLGKSWDERLVTKLPNGEWKRAWAPCVNIKPLKAVEMEAYYAPRIREKFGTNTVYCDVHTAVMPWYNVDYEAGTPGAGKLSTTFKAYGALMMNERKAYGGPVFSEGNHHWYYAGLNDGNYAQMCLPDPPKQPLLLDFDLRRSHPLQANVAMIPGPSWDAGFLHMMATQIAYGHIGFLNGFSDDVRLTAVSYYMMQQLQSRYTQVPVETILYRVPDGRMLPISDALPIAANKENQVYVRYTNGLEVYVNRNAEKHWTVTAAGREYDLCPTGWLAVGRDFLEYSTEIDGRRVHYVDSPAYTYVDAGDKPLDTGSMTVSGALVIRKDDPRGPKLIPLAGDSVTLPALKSAIAYTADDRRLGPAEVIQDGDRSTLKYRGDARYYVLTR